jgi:hypothetical protein
MKETTPAAMPPCFDRWCKRFDDIWTHQAQKREFRNYIGGLLGESERKNLSVEVFYREAKGWLGLSEYQVRDKRSLLRHFILVFCAYTFILWHTLTAGLRRRWASKPLNTFTEALVAFRTAMSFRFFDWLNLNRDVFAAYKASLGFIWLDFCLSPAVFTRCLEIAPSDEDIRKRRERLQAHLDSLGEDTSSD